MRNLAIIALTLPLTGCYTETHITRTVHHTDGSKEIYENKSHGYNYNPNFTGHYDSSSIQNVKFIGYPPPDALAPMQPSAFGGGPNAYGQYTIR